jgi:hypothetical protein
MKNTWTRLGGMVMILLAASHCNQEAERILYKGPDFVFFDSKAQVSLYENQKTPLKIPVKVSLAQSTDTDVTFEVVGDNVLAVSDYIVQTASPARISRGSYETTISILPVDNAVIQPEKRTITVRIKSVSNAGMSPQVVKEVEIDLLDDDCLPTVPKVSIFTGSVNIQGGGPTTTTGTGEGGAGGICGGTLVVTGQFFGTSNPSSAMTIILSQDPLNPTQGFASVVRFPLFAGSEVYEYEASGTYSETGKTITLNFSVYNTTDPSFSLTGTHIITPK